MEDDFATLFQKILDQRSNHYKRIQILLAELGKDGRKHKKIKKGFLRSIIQWCWTGSESHYYVHALEQLTKEREITTLPQLEAVYYRTKAMEEDLSKRYWGALSQLAEMNFLSRQHRTYTFTKNGTDLPQNLSQTTKRGIDANMEPSEIQDLLSKEFPESHEVSSENRPSSPCVRTMLIQTPEFMEISEVPFLETVQAQSFPIVKEEPVIAHSNSLHLNSSKTSLTIPKEQEFRETIEDGSYWRRLLMCRKSSGKTKSLYGKKISTIPYDYKTTVNYEELPINIRSIMEAERERHRFEMKTLMVQIAEKEECIETLQAQVKVKDAQISQLASTVFQEFKLPTLLEYLWICDKKKVK